jgi:hypothetical protein
MRASLALLVAALLSHAAGCGERELRATSATAAPERPAWRPEPRSPLGSNLADVRNYASALAFADVFKESSPFDDPDFADPDGASGSNLVKDENGWVRSFPGARYWTIMRRELDEDGGRAHYPAGDYLFRYRGAGTFSFGFDAQAVSHDPAAGEVRVRVAAPSTGGILLEVTETDPRGTGDYLREMSLRPLAPSPAASAATFNPWFLDSLRDFQVLRFMDWQGTNGSRQTRYAERTRPQSQTQASEQGVALEHMLELANELHVDPWFCMPHAADDDYVRRFARAVRERLDPDLAVFVEYSNEVWNPGFEQSRYASERGRALGLGEPENLRFYALRSVQIFRIWEEEIGDPRRLGRVLAGQNASPWASEQILDFEVPGLGPAHRFADYLAVAPYFAGLRSDGCDPENEVQDLARATPEAILERAAADVPRTLALAEQQRRLAESRRNAEGRPLALVAYEGGQHLVGTCGAENVSALTERLLAANRHPRMKALYLDYLAGWKRIGGRLFVHFTSTSRYTKWGAWGSREWYDAPPGPKGEALRAFAAANPRWWRE